MQVLEIYDSIRRPIAQEVARRSRDAGLIYECLLSPSVVGADLAETVGDLARRSAAAQHLLLWVKETTIMDDKDRALQALDTALSTVEP